MKIVRQVEITPTHVIVNGQRLDVEGTGSEMLKNVYRTRIGFYPKFFKMDTLCRLGFVASELLLQDENPNRVFDEKGRVPEGEGREDRAIIVFSRLGSLCNDKDYEHTIERADNYFPSPAVFVYTLPNIVTGELAIRNRYFGETSCYVLAEENEALMMSVAEETLLDPMTTSMLCGWLDCEDKEHFNAKIYLMER